MSINDSLLKSIQTMISKAISASPFDKTRQGIVLLNHNDGTYTIELDGVRYTNVSTYPNNPLINIGSVVKIKIPTNNTNNMYIISNVNNKIDLANPTVLIDAYSIDPTGHAHLGEDKDLYNLLVDLGWISEVIV